MLPLFPLQSVIYPGERLSLHIFEKRYQQLIFDCVEDKISFGIPVYINKKLDYGTEIVLKKIEKRYPGGESDVICIGKRVFRVKSFSQELPGKLYAGGKVNFMLDRDDGAEELQEELLKNIRKLYVELTIDKPLVLDIPFISYQVAHKVGLSLEQEYHVLELRSELERLTYLISHLKTTIPVIREMNKVKEIILMNGHFRNFDPLDFEDFKL